MSTSRYPRHYRSRSRQSSETEYINPEAEQEFFQHWRQASDGRSPHEYIDPEAENEFFNRLSQSWSADGLSPHEYIDPEAEKEFFNRLSQSWSADGYLFSEDYPEDDEEFLDGRSSQEYINPEAEEEFFHGHVHPRAYDGTAATEYFKPGVPLNDLEKKYCRCTAHVRAKQPDWCLQEHAWKQKRNGQTCYNPYPVCKASTGFRSNVECSDNFNFSDFQDSELRAYALERKIPIPQPYNRQQLISHITTYAAKPE